MKNKQKGFAHLLLVILVSVFAVGGIFLYSLKNGLIKTIPDQHNSTTYPTDTKSASSDLKTEELPSGDIRITNLKGNFEIMAPVTYKLSGVADNFNINFSGSDDGKSEFVDFSNLIFSIVSLEQKSLPDEVKEIYNSDKTNRGETPNFNDIKNIKLGDKEGFYYSCPFLVDQKCIFMPLDKQMYLFILTSYEDTNNRGYKEEIDQILSTISFLPNISNWKTYKNNKYGFEVKYYSESQPTEFEGTEEVGQFTYLFKVNFGNVPLKSQYGYILTVNNGKSLGDWEIDLIGHNTDKIDSLEQITINNYSWTKINYQIILTTNKVSVTTAIINHDKYGYAVTSSNLDIDQILSSFKFTD